MNNTLPPIHLLHCLVCQKRLFLLAQLNAPLIDTHRRILYLLACSNAACYSSLKAIRCISAQLNQPIHQLIPSSSIESDIQKGLCKSFFKESLPLEDQFGGLKIDMNELSLLMANRFKKTAASTIRTTASPTKPNITAPTIIANATTSTATATNDTNTTFHEIKKKNVKKASINAHDNSLQPSNTRLDNIEKNQIQDYIPCYEIAFEVDMPMNNLDSDDEFDRPLTKDQLEHTHQLLAQRSVANYIRVLNGKDLLVIDEAQNIPDIGKKLKLMVDEVKTKLNVEAFVEC